MENWLRFLRGYLRIRIRGFSPERFLNLCAKKGIFLWDVRCDADAMELFLDLKSFFRLRPIARKTGVQVVILERIGLPFFMPQIRKRWVFLFGILCAVFFWWGSTFFVWKIDFYGNVQVTDDQLETFLRERGIGIGTRRSRVAIPELEKAIRKEYEVVTWTSVKLVGTGLEVWIRENELTTDYRSFGAGQEEGGPDFFGKDLVSPYDAQVVSVVVRSGVPRVRAGETVREGQLLVEGKVPVYQEDQTVRGYLYVDADADIVLEHSLLFEAALPECYEKREYSGRCQKEYFLQIGEKRLRPLRKSPFFQDTELVESHVPDLFLKWNLPVKIGVIRHWEYLSVQKKYTKEEAESLLNEKISIFLATLAEKGIEILEKNVRIDKEGDCFLLYGRMTVRERVGGPLADIR